MIGTKFDKPLQDDWIIDPETQERKENPAPNTLSKYAAAADWCNNNKAMIEDKGEYYEVVTIPDPPLEDVKESKKSELASAWNRADEEEITTDVGTFECDTLSRNRINSAIASLAKSTSTREWTLKDGTVVTVTRSQLENVMSTWMTRCDTYHAKYVSLKAQVEAAITVEEVREIKWDSEK